MIKLNEEYYDIEFTPTIGLFYISLILKNSVTKCIALYSVFLIFPLFNDDAFLNYIIKRYKTDSLKQLLNDFVIKEKSNEFWIEYSLRYEASRRLCYESIYLGILTNSFGLDDYGLTLERDLTMHIFLEDNRKRLAIEKLGMLISDLSYQELLRIMKVGY